MHHNCYRYYLPDQGELERLQVGATTNTTKQTMSTTPEEKKVEIELTTSPLSEKPPAPASNADEIQAAITRANPDMKELKVPAVPD